MLNERMDSCEPVNEFLRYYLLRGAIGSRRSWPPIARSLYDYFSFLEVHELNWRDVEGESLVSAYRNYCLETVGHARNTVIGYLTYVCAFYTYAFKQRWVSKLPFDQEDRHVNKPRGELAHVDNGASIVSTRDVSPSRLRTLPKYLSAQQVRLLLGSIKHERHLRLVQLSLATGLRRCELATFPARYIFDPDAVGNTERRIRVDLDPTDASGMRTKGSHARSIYVPRKLMQALYFYRVQTRGETSRNDGDDHPELFLNHDGRPFAHFGEGISRLVKALGEAVGLKVTTHMLRHTFATHYYAATKDLLSLQRMLGHQSLETTQIYASLLDDIADSAVLAYDDELTMVET